MKGKLVKRSNGRFDLYKIEDVDQLNTIASSFDNPKGKLSLKNCQAIELGYDLDELVKEDFFRGKYQYHLANNHLEFFKAGFQKALEILGDKKFSENNIDEAFDTGYEMLDSPKKYNDTLKDFKESLEQTEWDVEIVCLHTGDPEHTTNTGLPKLDENGCLILKRL
jgi:hypothetical protein